MRRDRRRISGPLVSLTVAMLLVLPVTSARTITAFAEDGQFYVGMTVPVERLDASYAKTVDHTDPRYVGLEEGRGNVLQDKDSDDTFTYGIGFLAGYRFPLTGDGLYRSGEVDLAFHGVRVKGQLQGVGDSAGRNQPGES